MKNILKILTVMGLGLSLGAELALAHTDNPVVYKPVSADTTILPNAETTWTVEAFSHADLPLTYIWSAVSGQIRGQGATAFYVAPSNKPAVGFDTVTVVVRDDAGNVTAKSSTIDIAESAPSDDLGNLEELGLGRQLPATETSDEADDEKFIAAMVSPAEAEPEVVEAAEPEVEPEPEVEIVYEYVYEDDGKTAPATPQSGPLGFVGAALAAVGFFLIKSLTKSSRLA